MSTFIRLNGRGNAWPIQLGLDHPFYEKSYHDIANVSYSVIKATDKNFTKNNIEWEILIDAGHGAIQYLITHENRIPEALVLTHAHHDHTFGIDWLVQSYCRQNNMKPYPLYATKKAWDFTKQSYPHLESLVEFKELIIGKKKKLDEAGVEITPIPVFHGESAVGACMLVVECNDAKTIFSGDVLCPLIRKADYPLLRYANYFFTDTNNRFPYPKSNHWSLVKEHGRKATANYLNEWLTQVKLSHFIAPSLPLQYNKIMHEYFDSFLDEQFREKNLFLSVFEFVEELKPQNVIMVHYSGSEDIKFHGEDQLTDLKLADWANSKVKEKGITSDFFAPKTGDIFEII